MQVSAAVEFRVLGPFEVLVCSRSVPLGGAKQRVVLAALLAQANAVVSTDRLADILWADAPPSSAQRSVQKYVYHLREAIRAGGGDGDGEAVLLTRAPGYLLAVGPGQLDAARFAALVRDAQHRGANGEPQRAVEALDEALRLWRGPAFAEFADDDFARTEALRLEELRRLAIDERVEGKLSLGRHQELVAELEATAAADPLRERPRAQLMLALYRCGREAEALRAYQEYRRYLGDELGIEPSRELASLEEAILLQRRELDWEPPRPASGAEHVSGLAAPGLGQPTALGAETLETGAGVVLPVPGVLRDAAGEPFVGRDAELKTLMRAWKGATVGERQAVLIGGEPGVGKTRLAAQVASIVAAEDASVLYGRCDEDLGIPYQPWVEALRHLVGHEPRPFLAEHVARRGAELGRLIPELARQVGESPAASGDPDAERYLLFGAVVGLMAQACSDNPVLLVLEDLHWADKPSLLLLRHLIPSFDPRRLLVIATYRPTDLGAEHPLTDLLAALHREDHVQRIDLRGLDDSEVVALLEVAAGHTLGDTGVALAHALYRETDGNPFFTNEILRHLAETGAIYQGDDGRWVAEVDFRHEPRLPTSVREVIGRRVARLGEQTAQALGAAAVIGRDFELDLLAQVTDESEEHVFDLLDAAIRAVLIREVPQRPGRLSFSHALIEHTLYDALGPTRRQRLHGRVAAALETLCGDDPGDRLGELAYHWAQASRPAKAEKAIDCALRAGDQALAKLAPDDAVAWYAQALELIDRQPAGDELARCEALVRLGTAQRHAGDPRSRDTLLGAASLAQQRRHTGLLVRAALANNRGYSSIVGAVDEQRVVVLEAALSATAGTETPERAVLLATLAAELTWVDPNRARALSDEALVMARRVDDDQTLLDVLSRRPFIIWSPATLDERTANAHEERQVAERLGDQHAAVDAVRNLCNAATCRGDLVEADEFFDLTIRHVSETRLINSRLLLIRGLVWRRLLVGHIDAAEQAADEGLQIASQMGEPDALPFYAAQIYDIRRAQGRLDEILEMIDQTASENPGLPIYRASLAHALCEVDRLDDARIVFEPLIANGFTEIPFDLTWLTAMTMCAEAATYLDHRSAASLLAELLAPWRHQLAYTTATCTGSVARPLGLALATAGRLDEADEAFAEATAVHERIKAPIELARTQLNWARMLASRGQPGDPDRARALLELASTTANDLGLATIQRQTQSLLADLAIK